MFLDCDWKKEYFFFKSREFYLHINKVIEAALHDLGVKKQTNHDKIQFRKSIRNKL